MGMSNMSTYINILLISANIINVIYNILWILYGIAIDTSLVALNSVVTIIASSIIAYYKYRGYKASLIVPEITPDV